MKVTVSAETEKILALAETNKGILTNPYFLAGIAYAQLRVDEEREILTWNQGAVNDLIFNLLMADKITVHEVLGAYTATIKKKSKDKSELISALATKLMMYRQKWHNKNELPEFEKTVDDILKVAGF